MFMTIQETPESHINDVKLMHLSKTGHSYGIEYMIGDQAYFGKGYGAKTLIEDKNSQAERLQKTIIANILI